jgi:signal transduction histidine kinase
MVVGGSDSLRTLLYMMFTNIAGAGISLSLYSRERDLFLQRRRAEEAQVELDRRARVAEEADREKTRLLAAVSHDLRQPIMASLTFLDVLKSKLDKHDYAQVGRQADHLTSSVGMLGATLDHLLTAARYDSGTEPIKIEAVDLGVILDRLKVSFMDEARSRGVELRVRMPRRRLIVTSDATALWRVLMNLVSNGLKFTAPNGVRGRGVLVSASLHDGACRVHVVDTGIGIAPEHANIIWQPYMQLANEERNRQRGLGLGLFLVRRALDRIPSHTIRMRSVPGRGSRFTVAMPGFWVGEPEPPMQGVSRLSPEELALIRGAHVLVLEDDRDARQALHELFDDWGVMYSSGATLEELMRDSASSELDVDAIVTDYRLPGARNGAECIVELRRALETDAPAIIVTGEGDLAPIGKSLPGRTTLLQKPFETRALATPLIAAIRLARGAEGA